MGDIWTCKVGGNAEIAIGDDAPMRLAVEKAYRELTGQDPAFLFSGWAGTLNKYEQEVVDVQKLFEGPH